MGTINFIQSTQITTNNPHSVGLFDIFDHYLDKSYVNTDLFQQVKVVVPTKVMGNWLKQQLTTNHQICANIDFVVLISPIIEQIYKLNNPQAQIFDFKNWTNIIYDYLLEADFSNYPTLYQYLNPNGKLDPYLAFNLTTLLKQSFQEYIYYRTNEIIDGSIFEIMPTWQKPIWDHVFEQIGQQITYLDIYKYFQKAKTVKLPFTQLFIFALHTIAKSQLEILLTLSHHCAIYWFYRATSNLYYGDLLSSNARQLLDQKILKQPLLNLDDLYLNEGNLLVRNLAMQSRELIELLIAYDVEVKNIDYPNKYNTPDNLLDLIKSDIYNLRQRISHKYRISNDNNYYADPIKLDPSQINLSIQICHNKMREVQVLFETICSKLKQDPTLQLSDILVVAPNIEDYANYLDTVFTNEYLVRTNTNNKMYIPYIKLGKTNYLEELSLIELLFNTPYELSIEYFWELITNFALNDALQLNSDDCDKIHKWLVDNHTSFGYNQDNFKPYGYKDQNALSFDNLLNNLVLGFMIPHTLFGNELPLYGVGEGSFVPYDNIENSQLELCNKLINLVNLLKKLRNQFYLDKDNYQLFDCNVVRGLIETIYQDFDLNKDKWQIFEQLVVYIESQNIKGTINLPILLKLIKQFQEKSYIRSSLNGKLICASMNIAHHLPSKITYALGLNFGEYPQNFSPNSLSILFDQWSLADRNYNLEDKQIFLDLILNTSDHLYLSYVGHKQTDNSELKPSSVLGTLNDVIRNSLINYDELMPLILKYYPIHPFLDDRPKFSHYWYTIKDAINHAVINERWKIESNTSSTNNSQSSTDNSIDQSNKSITIQTLVNTLFYTNTNLYRKLNIAQMFKFRPEFADFFVDSLDPNNYRGQILNIFEKLHTKGLLKSLSIDQIFNYLNAHGLVINNSLALSQVKHFLEMFYTYLDVRGQTHKVSYQDGNITIEDRLNLDNDYNLIIMAQDIFTTDSIKYSLYVKAFVISNLALNGVITDSNNQIIKPQKYLIKLIDPENQVITYEIKFKLDETKLALNKLIELYLFSLNNPVLVHRAAITKYLEKKVLISTQKHLPLIVAKTQELQKTYHANYKNYELEALRNDPIASAICDDYFARTDSKQNTLIIIANLLDSIEFELV